MKPQQKTLTLWIVVILLTALIAKVATVERKDIVTIKYPEFIKFEAINDKVEMLRGFQVGMQVTAEGFVGGKEYTTKEGKTGYITSIKLAKIYENKPQAEAVPDAIPF